ncbi:PEP-CTERM sorting domain-containing protein [Micromonospora sp. KC721]|uniref:PEP-CTERM sorting domain-containing protein n=1 Tax=Micromonospora sp. KC721 TaxID=2530380 RepID=UPI00105177DC|nr:PEP-CTERM sorting domain-containing protein [Micromonospora sp. KC721]TDB79618.1 PEP-CTERM sorting domain-containing protein [Micromonospora sp. KC721]
MASLRPHAAKVQHRVPASPQVIQDGSPQVLPQGGLDEPGIPYSMLLMGLVAAAVGVGTHMVPESATPVGLALATFVMLRRERRQYR